jgi:hypothetical protein
VDDVADLPLVIGIRVRVDQRDGQRLDTRVDEVADDLLDLLDIDRLDHLALRAHALVGLARVLERGRRVGLDHDDPAGQRAWCLRTRQVKDLPEALGRDQPDARPFGLEESVRRNRRPMHDVLEVTRRYTAHLADPRHAVEHALRRVRGRRRRLDAVQIAALVVHEQQVGECPPDVDSEPVGQSLLL